LVWGFKKACFGLRKKRIHGPADPKDTSTHTAQARSGATPTEMVQVRGYTIWGHEIVGPNFVCCSRRGVDGPADPKDAPTQGVSFNIIELTRCRLHTAPCTSVYRCHAVHAASGITLTRRIQVAASSCDWTAAACRHETLSSQGLEVTRRRRSRAAKGTCHYIFRRRSMPELPSSQGQ